MAQNNRILELLKKHRESKISQAVQEQVSETQIEISPVFPDSNYVTDKHGNLIRYNSKQQEFINLAKSGVSCILIGAAGTGKTTCQKGAIQSLIDANLLPILRNHNHKYLPDNVPGVVVCAFTRRATNNIRRNMSSDLQGNCITIHKLLEYQPEYYEYFDEVSGKEKTKMSFEPARNSTNPLPQSIHTIIIEESSMVSCELFQEIVDACAHPVQFIFLGDIQQLPPVFGSAILGFKMLELPTVELTEVYRQALDSPIISLAHRILSGNPITDYTEWNFPQKLKLHPWKKKIAADSATLTLAKFFIHSLESGAYNPETDAILIPFNKACGTDELNKHIANKIAKQNQNVVYEIIHGFKKSYYSIGDKVLYDREDAIIKNIYENPQYAGAQPQVESVSLNYWGHYEGQDSSKQSGNADADIDFLLRQVASPSSDDDKVRAASHIIELDLLDSERTVRLQSAGELNNLILGYAITVHKSQGSEWDKVFVCFHNSHATMIQRELLYTAVTRAKRELFVICEEDTFTKGILSQRIKGNTLAEKAEFFKGKQESQV